MKKNLAIIAAALIMCGIGSKAMAGGVGYINYTNTWLIKKNNTKL